MIVPRGPAESFRALASPYSLTTGTPLTILTLVLIGIALRVWHFRADYSLNHDDICLALNVIGRNAGGLTRTLDYDQAAPLGFLWIERAVVRLIGPGERALRLIPLLCGCLSVVLMCRLARSRLPSFEAIAVLGFFAFSQAQIESGIQVKPYSLDVLVAIILVSVSLPLMRDAGSRNERITSAATGALALWLSLPAFFMLFGTGAVVGGLALVDRDRAALRRLIPVFCVWMVSAGGALWFSVRPGLLNSNLAQLDSDFMFPLHTSAQIVPWMIQAAFNLGSISTSVRLAPLAAITLAVSLTLMLFGRDRISLLLAAPIALCLLAAVAQLYPWLPRLIFFTAPLTLIISAREFGQLARQPRRALRILAASSVAIALAYSGLSAFKNILTNGSGFDDPRGAVAMIAKQWQPGDRIYASGAAMPCIIYYRENLHANQLDFVSSRNPVYVPNEIKRIVALPKLEGRLWFVYFEPGEKDFDRRILAYFHQDGSLISRSRHKNFTVALWDLHPPPKPVR